jgi:glycosyltransferase involved in cell wall biosynthesis
VSHPSIRNGGLRVGMVAARYLPYVGGIETHVDEVAIRLAAQGHQVTVLTTDTTGHLPRYEERQGFVIRRFPALPRGRDYYFSPALGRALWQGTFDVIHVQGIHTLVPPLALSVARRRRVPTVLTFHTGGSSSRLRTLIRASQWTALRPLLRSAAALVAVCEYEVETFMRSLGPPRSRIRLIRNGAAALPESDGEPPAITGAPLILSIGRLERYKGHHRLLQAMPEVLRRAPEARLAIVGTGPYEETLRSTAARLGIGGAVSFAAFGSNDRGALGTLVRSSDVVALLSDYEAHPVAIMEALAAGVRAVVAATSGLSELAWNGWAVSVPIDATPRAIARTLVAEAARGDAEVFDPPLPTWDGCVDALVALYREVVSCAS